MMKKEFPRRFLSLRDKDGSQRRSKSSPPENKHKELPPPVDSFLLLFKTVAHKDKAERLKNKDHKTRKTQALLREKSITDVSDDHIHDILAINFANGDPFKAAEFIALEQKSMKGVIVPYNPAVKMLGAENNGFVTCYLDSLLFSMFAKLEAYESILKIDFPPEDHRHKLVNMLRLWVNMLRSGKLIHTDLVELLQHSLADCGWKEALVKEQQDTSEAFAFITETLQLPLLPLQVDLFHQGKRDDDDHKVVYERLLNIAVPADPEGKGIALEDCLEEYFNTQVDVMRESEELRKVPTEELRPSPPPRSYTEGHPITQEIISESPVDWQPRQLPEPEGRSQLSTSPIDPRVSEEAPVPPDVKFTEDTVDNEEKASGASSLPRRISTRARSASVIQNMLIDDKGRSKSIDDEKSLSKAKRKGSIIVKAVTIPAWQFFRLIPWNAAPPNDGPSSNREVFMNFEERPCVGICLKRYTMDEHGHAKRYATRVDIPEEMRLPHFMIAEGQQDDEEAGRITTDYKLVLQAVICHRGDSVQSGHYFTFAKMAPKLISQDVRDPLDPPPDYEEATWVVFDDIAEQRVLYIDDVQKAMSANMPYLLLYQVVPMFDTGEGPGGGKPPSYDDFRSSTEAPSSFDVLDKDIAQKLFEESNSTPRREAASGSYHRSSPPSIRLSIEFDQPHRKSSDEGILLSYPGSSVEGDLDSRRPSVNFLSFAADQPGSGLVTPLEGSPVLAPVEESTATRLARAASRFTKSRGSRPQSQVGESRLSLGINRLGGLGGLMKQSKEGLVDLPAKQSKEGLVDLPTTTIGAEQTVSAETNGEDPQHLHPSELTPRAKGHKRGKSKEKAKHKHKGDQPDRECTVM